MYYDSISIAEGSQVGNLTAPSGTSFPQNANIGELFYRSDLGALYTYDGGDWVSSGSGGTASVAVPKITSVIVTDSNYSLVDDVAVALSGGYAKITGSGFEAGSAIIIGTTQVSSATFISSTEIRIQIPALSAGVYPLYVVNPDGGTAIKPDGLEYSAFPTWGTPSALPTQQTNSAVSIQLLASENASFALAQGSSLPDGLTLSSTGLISGSVVGLTSTTSYAFTIIATDAQNQDSSRSFSLKVSALSVTAVEPVTGAFADIDDTAVDTAGGFIKVTGTGFENGIAVSVNGVAATSVTYVSSTEIYAQLPATAAGTYSLTLTNAVDDVLVTPSAVTFSGPPVWTTAASLPIQYSAAPISIQLAATGGVTSYQLKTGSTLPTGLSMTSAGLISGTVSVAETTVYTFTVVATDAENQDSEREFTLRVSIISIGTVYVTDIESVNLDDTAVDITGGYVKVTGTGFKAGCSLTIGGVPATTTVFVNATEIRAIVPATSAGTYAVTVTNSDGDLATKAAAVAFSPSPTWTTATALPDQTEDIPVSIQLTAALATSYTLANGSTLPAALTLSASGLLTGTFTGISDIESYSFTVVATDAENQSSSRTFTLAVIPAVATSSTQSNTKLTSLLMKSSAVEGANTLGFEDASSNNFPITRNGNATETSLSPFNPSGWSTYFDGTGDFLNFSPITLADDFTIEAWVYKTAVDASGYSNIFSSTGGLQLSVDSTTAGSISMYMGATAMIPASGTAVTPNAWNHLAWVRRRGTCAAYVNGILQGSGISASSITVTNIGNWHLGGYEFNGYISNVRIVRGVVYDPMVPQFKVPTAPLTDIPGTVLLACNSASHVDASPSRTTITVNGDASVKAFSPFIAYEATENSLVGGSVYFDGTGDYMTVPSSSEIALGTGDFTLEFWMNSNDVSDATQRGMLQTSTTAGGFATTYTTGITFLQGASSNNYGALPGGLLAIVGGVLVGSTSSTIPTNTWMHVALVRATGVSKLYINGSVVGSASTPANLTGTNMVIGGYYNTSYLYSGAISNLRLVKGTALYTANFAPSTTALTAVTGTSLLTCQSSPIRDASSNNFAITPVGDAKYSVMGPFRSASSGSSVYFDGGSDYLSVAANSAFEFTGNYTIECWVYFNNLTGVQDIIGNYVSSTATDWIIILNTSRIEFYPSSAASYVWSSTIVPNRWYHIAAVRNGNTCSLYIDGVSVGTPLSFSGTLGSASRPVHIGKRPAGGTYLNGYISNARIVKGTALYTANFTPSTSPLTAVAGTSLLTCQSTAIVDNSSNNFTITRNGVVVAVNAGPFISAASDSYSFADPTFGSSVYFDGNGDYMTVPANSAFQFGTGNFTIEFWQNYSSLNNFQTIISSGYVGGLTAGGWVVQTGNGDGKINFYYQGASSATLISSETGASPIVSVWYHIAIVKNGTTVTIYRNGVNVGSGSTSNDYISNAQVVVGGGANTGFNNYWVNGYISNLRIVKGTAVYTSNFTPSTSPLTAVAGTSLLTCQSSAIVDNSSNSFAITSFGDTKPTTFGPFSANVVSGAAYTPATPAGSVYFDGTGDYLTVPSNSAFTLGSTDDFTIECWVNSVAQVNAYTGIVTTFTDFNNGYTNRWFLGITNNAGGNKIRWYDSTGNGFVDSASTLPLNTWTHISAVRRSGTTTLYVNGVAEGIQTSNQSYTTQSSLTIGYVGSGGTFNGYISNLRIVKGTALYTANFTPSTSPLTAIGGTSLLTCQADGLKDASSNNFTVTPVGDVKPVGVTPFNVPALGKSVFFDGTGDSLSIADSEAFNFGTGNFTVECWVNINNVASNPWIFTQWQSSSNSDTTSSFYLIVGSSKISAGVAYNNSTAQFTLNSTTTISNGRWYHVALVRNGATTTLYMDGIAEASNTTLGSMAVNNGAIPVLLGMRQGGVNYLNGHISNARIVKGTALYTANFTPSTSPLTAVTGTSLLTCQSAAIVDNSTNAFAITRNGEARSSDFTPFALPAKSTYAGSVYFDGTGDSLSIPASTVSAPLTGDFTYECWAYPTSATVSYRMIFGIDNYAAGQPFRLYQYGTNFQFWYAASAGNFINSNTITINQWYHLAITRSGTSIRFFVNGTQVGSTLTSSANYPSSIFRIGQDSGALYPFNGYISNVRVNKGTAVYTSNFVPPTGPLAAIPGTVFLLDNASPGIYDATQKIAMETVGTVADVDTTAVVKKFNSSVFFDGSGGYIKMPPTPELAFDSGNFTVEFWAYFLNGSENANRGIYASYPQTNTYAANALFIGKTINGAAGKVCVWIYNQSASGPLLIDTDLPASNTWIHYAITRNGNTFTMWKNGVSVASATFSGVVNAATNNTFIGVDPSYFTTGSHYGYIEDLRVVKGQALYTATFTPPATALTV